MSLKLHLLSSEAVEEISDKEYENYKSLKKIHDFKLSKEQEKSVSELKINNKEFRVHVLQGTTGSGKTRTSVEAAISFLIKSGASVDRILWIADRNELCEQAVESFLTILPHRNNSRVQISRYWGGNSIDLDIDSSGKRFIPGVTVTSTQQLRNRLDSGDAVGRYLIENSRIIIIIPPFIFLPSHFVSFEIIGIIS